MMTLPELHEILGWVRYPGYTFTLVVGAHRPEIDRPFRPFFELQVSYEELDAVTNKMETQRGRKWRISEHTTKSEFVQTCFKAVLTSMEHRTREHFTYKNARVYGPHLDVEALVILCQDEQRALDERPLPPFGLR